MISIYGINIVNILLITKLMDDVISYLNARLLASYVINNHLLVNKSEIMVRTLYILTSGTNVSSWIRYQQYI